jgi:hypothetical protein
MDGEVLGIFSASEKLPVFKKCRYSLWKTRISAPCKTLVVKGFTGIRLCV